MTSCLIPHRQSRGTLAALCENANVCRIAVLRRSARSEIIWRRGRQTIYWVVTKCAYYMCIRARGKCKEALVASAAPIASCVCKWLRLTRNQPKRVEICEHHECVLGIVQRAWHALALLVLISHIIIAVFHANAWEHGAVCTWINSLSRSIYPAGSAPVKLGDPESEAE